MKFSDTISELWEGWKKEGAKRKAGARHLEILCTPTTDPSTVQTWVQKQLCCRNHHRTQSGGDGKHATTAHWGEGKSKGERKSYTHRGKIYLNSVCACEHS